MALRVWCCESAALAGPKLYGHALKVHTIFRPCDKPGQDIVSSSSARELRSPTRGGSDEKSTATSATGLQSWKKIKTEPFNQVYETFDMIDRAIEDNVQRHAELLESDSKALQASVEE